MSSTKEHNNFLLEAVKAAAAKNGVTKPTEEATPNARQLEILFYGLMCFDPLEDRSGYRVLFPNGLDSVTALMDIPAHAAGLWVRDRSARTTARWSGLAFNNDFFVNGKRSLTITGLASTPLVTTEFEGRITNLQDCHPNGFTIKDEPDTVIDMRVDQGTLSAHVVDGAGMIVVKWTVQPEAGVPVRFTFGSDFVEVPPDVMQVFLANASDDSDDECEKHFQLFRKLSKFPENELTYQLPSELPKDLIVLPEPTFGYTRNGSATTPANGSASRPATEPTPGLRPIVGGIEALTRDEVVARTPCIVCSAVVSKLRAAA